MINFKQNLLVDWLGLLLATFFIAVHLAPIAIPAFGILNELDPAFVFLEIFYGLPTTIFTNIVFVFFRIVIIVPLGYATTINVRSFLPFVLCLGVSQLKLLHYILRIAPRKIRLHTINLYNEQLICFQIIQTFLSTFFFLALTAILFSSIMGINGVVLGWKILPLNFYALIPVFTVLVLVHLEIFMRGAIEYSDLSHRILRTWANYVKNPDGFASRKTRAMLGRKVTALRELKVPAGAYEYISRPFRLLYLYILQGRVIDSILATAPWVDEISRRGSNRV